MSTKLVYSIIEFKDFLPVFITERRIKFIFINILITSFKNIIGKYEHRFVVC